ncbi:gamma carbonic anhydrase family protein [Abyssicoccus albus]|uniref:gamma carbonic anhydrase family protein n=1 Tax=Abyssicoccus albus TaxID=1817405 RepID=UPI00097E2662|nr:gamma carbonic anhydrase family protein [Abyssicoccus albus]AQL56522.1 gamma carbonic anhydrase family protein [Abyssicoccus albus]
MLIRYENQYPKVHNSAYIAPNATIIGNVTIDASAIILFNAILRGDLEYIHIGKNSNIQDLCILHQSPNAPTIVGDNVTVGHRVTLHGCHIEDHALIGMDSTVLDGAVIGEGSFVGAGSLVTQNKIIPPNSLVFGRPAKVIRTLTDKDRKEMKRILATYQSHKKVYESENS